jgi:hypothetical protein
MTRRLGVSKSGFYEWDGRAPSDTERHREELVIGLQHSLGRTGICLLTG